MTTSTASVPHFRMYIGGQWVDTDDRYELANPANEQLVATAARGTVEHADQAVAAALAAHRRGGVAQRHPARAGSDDDADRRDPQRAHG